MHCAPLLALAAVSDDNTELGTADYYRCTRDSSSSSRGSNGSSGSDSAQSDNDYAKSLYPCAYLDWSLQQAGLIPPMRFFTSRAELINTQHFAAVAAAEATWRDTELTQRDPKRQKLKLAVTDERRAAANNAAAATAIESEETRKRKYADLFDEAAALSTVYPRPHADLILAIEEFLQLWWEQDEQ
jgi:hypothetical protein